jgi:hypothetical protein
MVAADGEKGYAAVVKCLRIPCPDAHCVGSRIYVCPVGAFIVHCEGFFSAVGEVAYL